MRRQIICFSLTLMLLLGGLGCQTKHQIETVHKVEVAPMHITIDVNVKVDRALDDFFGDLDAAEERIEPKTE
jgi:hypothetical protein